MNNREEQIKPLDGTLTRLFFHVSQLYLYLFAVNILVVSILFLLGATIKPYVLPLSFFLAVVALAVFYDEKINWRIIIEVILGICVFVLALYMASQILDFTYDGNAYHKLGIGLLNNGWNPIYEMPGKASTRIIGVDPSDNLWIETYGKATWFFAASVYSMAGDIECGKAYTMLGMFCAFFLIRYYLKKKRKNKIICLAFPLAVALNPIAMAQVDTFYVDGYLHTMLFILVFALYARVDTEKVFTSKTSASLIAASMIMLGNIKFTGLFYGGLFCIAYYVWECTQGFKNRGRDYLKECCKSGVYYLAIAIVTIMLAGSSTYVTNTIRHGFPLYPLMGEGSIDIMTENSPFAEVNHFRNLFLSLFSRLDNFSIIDGKTVKLKIPFTVYSSEFDILGLCDARLSGFGVLFSGLLIISMIALLIILVTAKKDQGFYLLMLNCLVCVGLTFGISESWWARYSPYVYMFVLMGLFVILNKDHTILLRCGGVIFALLILINSCAYTYNLRSERGNSIEIKKNITNMSKENYVEVYTRFTGLYFNLRDKGVNYIINEDLVDDLKAQEIGYKEFRWRKS